MALTFTAAGYLEMTWGTAPGLPLTIFCYGKTTSFSTQMAASSGAPNGGTPVVLEVGKLSPSGYAFAQHNIPGSSRGATGTLVVPNAGWVPLMAYGQTASPGTEVVYGATSSATSDSTTRTAQSHTRFRVGASAGPDTLTYPWSGDIGEVAVWIGLTQAESEAVHAAIVAGALPESQQAAKLVDVWDLQTYSAGGTYTGRVNSKTLTAGGSGISQAATHPITRAAAGPTITTQPSNQTVTAGATFTFTVAASASGGGTLGFQWRKNGADITGATSASYSGVGGTDGANGDTFACVVTEAGGTNPGSVTSSAATLTVNSAATAITLSGPSGGVSGVASTNFTVGADGAITGTVTVTPSDAADGGTFSPTSVAISSGTPTATFTYTPASAGAKTISVTNDGGLANPSSLTYTATSAGATVTVNLTNNTNSPIASASIPKVAILKLADITLAAALTNQPTDASGDMSITSVALAAGTDYLVVASDDTGATVGVEKATAA